MPVEANAYLRGDVRQQERLVHCRLRDLAVCSRNPGEMYNFSHAPDAQNHRLTCVPGRTRSGSSPAALRGTSPVSTGPLRTASSTGRPSPRWTPVRGVTFRGTLT